LEDKQGEEREGIKKRKTKLDSENPSFSHPSMPIKAYGSLNKIYISKQEICQSPFSNIYNIVLVLTNRRAINENNKIILKGDEGEKLSETCGDYRRWSCHSGGDWKRGLLGEFDSREVFLPAHLLSRKRYESIPIPDRSPH